MQDSHSCEPRNVPTRTQVSNGRRYHRDRCAKCLDCERKLDSHTLHLGGDDKEIYCAGCYGRRFGQAGYRGSQSTTWADEQSNANLRDADGSCGFNRLLLLSPATNRADCVRLSRCSR